MNAGRMHVQSQERRGCLCDNGLNKERQRLESFFSITQVTGSHAYKTRLIFMSDTSQTLSVRPPHKNRSRNF